MRFSDNQIPTFLLFGFFCFLALVLVGLVVTVYRSARAKIKNDQQPVLTVPAHIIAKRADTSGTSIVTTSYYVTYELAGAERLEFEVTGQEYGLLAEGDQGMLTYQGTNHIGFARNAMLERV